MDRELKIQCCMCGKYKASQEQWVNNTPEVDAFYQRYYLISHGFCPSCREIKQQEIREYFKRETLEEKSNE